jgi:hypothetical protein
MGDPGWPRGALPAGRGRHRNPRPNWAGARHRRADTPGASAWERRYRRAGLQLQSNRSDGGGRGAGAAVGSPRWVSIRRMTTGSSMVATTRIRPPHRVQANTSTPNVCRISSGHDHLRDAGGGGASALTVVAGSLLVTGGGADSGSLWCPPSITTGSRCAAPLASSPPSDGGALDGTGGVADPHATAAWRPTNARVSRS